MQQVLLFIGIFTWLIARGEKHLHVIWVQLKENSWIYMQNCLVKIDIARKQLINFMFIGEKNVKCQQTTQEFNKRKSIWKMKTSLSTSRSFIIPNLRNKWSIPLPSVDFWVIFEVRLLINWMVLLFKISQIPHDIIFIKPLVLNRWAVGHKKLF